ncbi:MAG: peptide-methionine (S)-S-oxide reductase MsrA [Firmicutes bacterium]|nr:peptide-methionine (S)-S-oxide reductase MsrA [Bacillota bacterium]
MPSGRDLETATLAGGCFWCLEAIFDSLVGIVSVQSGFAGGTTPNPSYEEVCTGATGHAEVVQIVFDPRVISFAELLEVYFDIHDPTTLNRQGPDIGTQYRSAMFYHSAEQKRKAEAAIAKLEAEAVFDLPIVTEVVPLTAFYPAEDYHEDYYEVNPNQPYCRTVIGPKVAKFRRHYEGKLKP